MADASSEVLLNPWQGQAVRAVSALSDADVASRYRDLSSLSHYVTVSARFADDVDLERAAFLHGVPSGLLSHLSNQGLAISASTVRILEDRERLKELARTTGGADRIAAQISQNVIPSLADERAAILLVEEQLHHLDPAGEFERYLRAVYSRAEASPTLPKAGYTVDDSKLRFIEGVVVPLAQMKGLWAKRNLAHDLVVIHRTPEFAANLAQFMGQAAGANGPCERLIETLKGLIRDSNEFEQAVGEDVLERCRFRWDWHHLGSIAQRLKEQRQERWSGRLGELGYATVLVPKTTTAYALLGLVHVLRPSLASEFRDYMTRPTPGGYKALHSAIELPLDGNERPISIRFVRLEDDPSIPRNPPTVIPLSQKATDRPLRVYTPLGEPKYLREGAVVLDFAYNIHTDWATRVRSASVNGKQVDALAELKPGDTVTLELSRQGSVLEIPQGWEMKVTELTGLRKAVRRERRRSLVERGGKWISARLSGYGFQVPANNVEALVDRAISFLQKSDDNPKDGVVQRLQSFRAWTASEWLVELGLLDSAIRGERIDRAPRIDEHRGAHLLKLLMTRVLTQPELVLPKEMRGLSLSTRLCEECTPDYMGMLMGHREESTLVLHRNGAPCARAMGAQPVFKKATARAYLTIEGSNRVGLVADIVKVLHDAAIDIVDIAGRRVLSSVGLVRVEIECPSSRFLDRLTKRLTNVRGVKRVLGPDDPVDRTIERHLPARRHLEIGRAARENPYVCNIPIVDPRQFYGRSSEIAELNACLDSVRGPVARGSMAFVQGFLKSGKTSLALNFFNRLLQNDQPVFWVFVEAQRKERADDFFERLRRAMLDEVQAFAVKGQRDRLSGLSRDPVEALAAVSRYAAPHPVVLAVDEAVRLFDANWDDVEQRAKLLKFVGAITTSARVMVIWIGPTSAAKVLPWDFQEVLMTRSARISLTPFNETEVGHLLAAQKLDLPYEIRVPISIYQMVHRLCGGDPYWIGLMANRMWEEAGKRSDPAISYIKEDVEWAQKRLWLEASPFELRLEHMTRENQPAARLFLRTLSSREDSQQAIAEGKLMEQSVGGTERKEAALAELEAVGLVSKSCEEGLAYRLTAPILHRFLANYWHRKP